VNWKSYEKEILKYFRETYLDSTISFDKKIKGRFSKVNRQIDILIEGLVAGYAIKIVVDCKYFSKNIDVKHVEGFASMIDDVDAHQGVLITKKGYSKAAINRAFYGNQKLELDILNFSELEKFQNFRALPYSGHFGVNVPAPFGWVLDLNDKVNSFATLHQRGLNLSEAKKKNEWMYMDFWKINEPNFEIEHLIDIQNNGLLNTYPKANFSYNNLVNRKDGLNTKIRIADIKEYPAIEVTGFLQFESHIFFIVLFTPKELLSKNLRKLQYLLENASSVNVTFDNNSVIKQSLEEISKLNDQQQIADRYYQIGSWYQEMDDIESAFINYKKSLEFSPAHYSRLKDLIRKSLSLNLTQECLQFANQLIEIELTNPTVPQDFIEIFIDNGKPSLLVELFNKQIGKNKNTEVLGNLNYHLGLLYFNTQKIALAKKHMVIAEQKFKKSLPGNHHVFNSLKKFRKMVKSS